MDLELLNSLIGKPYEDFGTGPDSYDCYGLVLKLGEMYGITIPNVAYGCTAIERDSLINGNKVGFIPVQTPQFGDIIAFRVGKFVTHIGWMIDATRFIHTTKTTNVTITRIDSPKYTTRIEGYYRCLEH